MKIQSICSLLISFAMLTGCATSPTSQPGPGRAVPQLSINERAFWSRLLQADIIYLPEVHDNDAHHRLQERVITGLHDRGEPVILAMEMFNLDQQPGLNRWQSGRLSLEAFFTKINWQASWGDYSEGYASILKAAKQREIPVKAMNAPKSVVRAVSADQPIAAEDRRYLPQRFRTPAGGLAFFKTQMQGHPGMTASSWDRYYAVQALWEQTMASTILALSKAHPESMIVVMLGQGHSDPRFGVPYYVAQKTGQRQIIVDPDKRMNRFVEQPDRSTSLNAMAHD